MSQIHAVNSLFSKTVLNSTAKNSILSQCAVMDQWISPGNQKKLCAVFAKITNSNPTCVLQKWWYFYTNVLTKHTESESKMLPGDNFPFACSEQNRQSDTPHCTSPNSKLTNVGSSTEGLRPTLSKSIKIDTSEVDDFLRLMNKLHIDSKM